jgi:adenylate cyclase
MARNVEIKARLSDFDKTMRKARQISERGPVVLRQEDFFFRCGSGRLKLRVFADQSAELIAYARDDTRGPKASDYVISPVSDPATMRQVLERSLGVGSVVRKTRHLFLTGRTRIHLDQVDGLGEFLELEVVLRPGEQESMGVAEARDLMTQLAVCQDALIDRAYVDLVDSD